MLFGIWRGRGLSWDMNFEGWQALEVVGGYEYHGVCRSRAEFLTFLTLNLIVSRNIAVFQHELTIFLQVSTNVDKLVIQQTNAVLKAPSQPTCGV